MESGMALMQLNTLGHPICLIQKIRLLWAVRIRRWCAVPLLSNGHVGSKARESHNELHMFCAEWPYIPPAHRSRPSASLCCTHPRSPSGSPRSPTPACASTCTRTRACARAHAPGSGSRACCACATSTHQGVWGDGAQIESVLWLAKSLQVNACVHVSDTGWKAPKFSIKTHANGGKLGGIKCKCQQWRKRTKLWRA